MNPEPKTQSGMKAGPVPGWLVVFAAVWYCGALLYLIRNSGEFHPQVYAPYRSFHQLVQYQPVEELDPLYRRGGLVYGMMCAACHQGNGGGMPGQSPPLAGSEWVLQKDPARLIRLPLLGASGPITVRGVNHTPSVVMPPMANALTEDADVAAVLTYIRQTWGNKAPGVTVAQVRQVRAEIAGRKEPTTAAELLKIPVTE
jgi:mono/diheme cytochrome c family protein